MGALLYHPEWEAARERLTCWWNGGDIGRAIMHISTPLAAPLEDIPALPEPAGWITHYSTKDLPYRVNQALRGPATRQYFGETLPSSCAGDLAPNCLALYLGCRGVEMPDTVWCEPFLSGIDDFNYGYNPENFYWQFSQQAFTQTAARGKGKFIQQFPDLIEGLDSLAAMRGTEDLLEDLLLRPELVQAHLRKITDLYFHYYDMLYNIIRDEVGGSLFWCWAPGRMAKFQCDFSAMLSPALFREFMVPVLTEMTERVGYSMYHWDGPGATCHLEALLSIPRLNMLQWTPGAGAPPPWDTTWWPMYHQVLDGGKKLNIAVAEIDHLRALKREFGEQTKMMLIGVWAEPTPQEAEAMLRVMEF